MVIFAFRCIDGKCDEDYHAETIPVNPTDTDFFGVMLEEAAHDGVMHATVETCNGDLLAILLEKVEPVGIPQRWREPQSLQIFTFNPN